MPIDEASHKFYQFSFLQYQPFVICLLQVTWDEPDLLHNVKRVSPWLVELVSTVPAIHLSPFSPPRKKLRLPQHPSFPLDGQFPMPNFPGNLLGHSNPFGCLPDTIPAGMQGARQAHYGLPLQDIHLNKMQTGLLPAGFSPLLDHAATHARSSNGTVTQKPSMSESVSCVLTMAHCSQASKKTDDAKTPQLVLFGQPILTEQQISLSCSGDAVSPVLTGNSSSEGNLDKMTNFSDGSGSAVHQQGLPARTPCDGFQWFKDSRQDAEPSLETGHCKVFMDSEDVGRTLDLSLLGSYNELYRKLAEMFAIENSETLNNVLYRDNTGTVKHIGEEPFRYAPFAFCLPDYVACENFIDVNLFLVIPCSEFIKTARRLTILTDSSSDNVGR